MVHSGPGLLTYQLVLRALFIDTTSKNPLWTDILLWIIRIAVLSLLLRTYLFPWIVRRLLRHVRVRSVSFRSIKGLYIRRGVFTCRVERVTWARTSVENSRRFTVKLEGFRFEVYKRIPPVVVSPSSGIFSRLLRFIQLHRFLWDILSGIYTLLDPFVRPVIRNLVVSCLRLGIHTLPKVFRAVSLEIDPLVIVFHGSPQREIRLKKILVHSTLTLQDPSSLPSASPRSGQPRRRLRSGTLYGWKDRMAESFQRSLDSALEKVRGCATIFLSVQDVSAVIKSPAGGTELEACRAPKISVSTSMSVDAHAASIQPHSISSQILIGDVVADFSRLSTFLKQFRSDTPSHRGSRYLQVPTTLKSTTGLLPSPTSPLLNTLSLLPRRIQQQPCLRLRDHHQGGRLSTLLSLQVEVTSCKLLLNQRKREQDTYSATLSHLVIQLSPSEAALHRQWFGHRLRPDNLDCDIYSFSCSIPDFGFEHASQRVLTVSGTQLQAVARQWPTPWLVVGPFMQGDANAPTLLLKLVVGQMELAESLDSMCHLLQVIQDQETAKTPPRASKSASSLPRLGVEVQCGPVCARLFLGTESSSPIVETITEGLSFSFASNFVPEHPILYSKHALNDLEYFPLDMQYMAHGTLRTSTVRVLPTIHHHTGIFSPTIDSCHGHTLLRCPQVEFRADGHAVASIKDDGQQIAFVDLDSLILDMLCTLDGLFIQLRHPALIDALARIIETLSGNLPLPKNETLPDPLVDKLPVGVNFTISLSQIQVSVASPTLEHTDQKMYRGLTLAGHRLSFQYCSMRSHHTHRLKNLPLRSQTRHKLSLPEEVLMDAVAAARASTTNNVHSSLCRASIPELSLSTLFFTLSTMKDTDNVDNTQPFLEVTSITFDGTLTGNRDGANLPRDTFEVHMRISDVKATFHLGHVYSSLLSANTLAGLFPRQRSSQKVKTKRASMLKCFTTTVKTTQVLFMFPKQRLACRIDSLNTKFRPGEKSDIIFHRAVAWVPLAAKVNRWQDEQGERWHQALALSRWYIYLKPTNMTVEGDSIHMRIPFGYILADLILDMSVTLKAVKHLTKVTRAGRLSPVSDPLPEGPKVIPRVDLRISHMCLEAEDDPLESRLGLIWRVGEHATKTRIDREEAFIAKVAAILAQGNAEPGLEYQFSPEHSVSIDNARQRLDHVHALDWRLRFEERKTEQMQKEAISMQRLLGKPRSKSPAATPNIVPVSERSPFPPLFRATLSNFSIHLDRPTFPVEDLSDLLFQQGSLPKETRYSFLVPMHLNFSISSVLVTLRDYPLPLIDVPFLEPASIEFDSDVVIAEEMGSALSVDWVDCPVVQTGHKRSSFSISVPKTIMPVKSYADARIKVLTSVTTKFAWAVSYGPATQDLMKILDSLSSSARDPSPGLGFWDKLRLIFHWTFNITFNGDVHFYMKGSRDPYSTADDGAGFTLVWQGSPKLLIGRQNSYQELIQLTSDAMLIVVPELGHLNPSPLLQKDCKRPAQRSSPFKKVCAEFRSGIHFGLGFAFERSCGPDCPSCIGGAAVDRPCRFFEFLPHHAVRLEKKSSRPVMHSPEDSYRGFRSDFIHLSLSLQSSLKTHKDGSSTQSSSLHLSPKTFRHFWSWWSLFDSVMSLPIRQGSYYPSRAVSPKFSRHLATIKYRIQVPQLFVTHGYIDDSRDTWVNGVTPWVGVKGFIDELQVDMHQRDQTTIVKKVSSGVNTKVIRRKAFYAAELVMKGLDLRAMLAVFPEPLKRHVPVAASSEDNNYRTRNDLPAQSLSSTWYSADDFIELDWFPTERPTLHILPVAACPRFMYFKRNSTLVEGQGSNSNSKFGNEKTHHCLLHQEPSAAEIQISLANARVKELMRNGYATHKTSKMTKLLEQYVSQLESSKAEGGSPESNRQYQIPSDTVSPDEWAEFDNVYQIHCLKVFMDSAIRDIMMQYYNCSRARRGLEYHMAERAVKFIRDQAETVLAATVADQATSPKSAQAAAQALRKILGGEVKIHEEQCENPHGDTESSLNPMDGWSDGVSVRKSHCCQLLKPQVVLRNRDGYGETCIVAALQAKLQSFGILDELNVADPVSGKIMTRTYASLSDLQMFAPTRAGHHDDNCIPLEVLIDFRCESEDFDRLVPPTHATFQYDKFNRLRLRNNVTSIVKSTQDSGHIPANHLQDQTDLVQIRIPNFTVTANDGNFATISNIVTKLLLFSDIAHKTRLDRLETLLFSYDFADLQSASQVVADLQERLRSAITTERIAHNYPEVVGEDIDLELLRLRGHIFLLAEELAFIFDAIKLAQDQDDHRADQKSALLVHASSADISWRMLDDDQDLLAKLAVQDIDYHWLSRQDSSTYNSLAVGNMQAFDGSPNALWTEILCKYDDHSGHPLAKRGLFLLSNWSKAPKPIGGITIYEGFELMFHPMRLQIDAKVGKRIMDYVWPARKMRSAEISSSFDHHLAISPPSSTASAAPSSRVSLDDLRPVRIQRAISDMPTATLSPPLRRIGTSRSFTDLRSAALQLSDSSSPPSLQRTRSSENLATSLVQLNEETPSKSKSVAVTPAEQAGDAAEMRTRSSQKTFVFVRVSSLSLLLSVLKEGSFSCRDAKIRTRDLEYHNQTWSFEDLVNQFIPSDMSWKGWVKIALHQPLVPVFPVARELFSKTKWLASKTTHDNGSSPGSSSPAPRSDTPHKAWKIRKQSTKSNSIDSHGEHRRNRKTSLFSRASPTNSKAGSKANLED